MTKPIPQGQSPTSKIQRTVHKFINSKFGDAVGKFPPTAWVIRSVSSNLVRITIGKDTKEQSGTERIDHVDLESTLKGIVIDVVESLGYVGAMVATYEPDDSLPVKAYYVDPKVASDQKIREWEDQLSEFSDIRLSLTNLEVAKVYVHQKEYAHNLSVQACHSKRPERSKELFSLLTPVVPDKEVIKNVIQGIQDALGVREVIAVPFFLETIVDGKNTKELVGNLFALSRKIISLNDENILLAFGRQAAAAILSERRRHQIQAVQELIFNVQASLQSEEQILQRIVKGVVDGLGYVAAMVATYELDDSLPIRAYYADPNIATDQKVREWEAQLSDISGIPLSLTNSEIAKVYVHQDEYKNNLSVKAFVSKRPERSRELFSLFTPVVPDKEIIKQVIQGVQDALQVQEVIAIPFFLEAADDQDGAKKLVGNLFALTRSEGFSSGEIELLRAFGQQAAAGLRNARLYRQIEEQRQIAEEQRHQAEEQHQLAEKRRQAAEIFGKMAFSASASVHDLRNKVGVVRTSLQILKMLDRFPEDERGALLEQLNERTFRNLDQIVETLDTLHEPFHQVPDTLVDVTSCISRAASKASAGYDTAIDICPSDDIPEMYAAQDMLIEAFKVLIKNAVEAVAEKDQAGHIRVTIGMKDSDTIEVSINDNGIGIKPENLTKIFEMRWSTKRTGLGFGLFWTKDYIEGIGGSIDVQSTYGEGTTFFVTIPVRTRQGEKEPMYLYEKPAKESSGVEPGASADCDRR